MIKIFKVLIRLINKVQGLENKYGKSIYIYIYTVQNRKPLPDLSTGVQYIKSQSQPNHSPTTIHNPQP